MSPSVRVWRSMQESSACGCCGGKWWFIHMVAEPGVGLTFKDRPWVTYVYQLSPPPKAFKILLQARKGLTPKPVENISDCNQSKRQSILLDVGSSTGTGSLKDPEPLVFIKNGWLGYNDCRQKGMVQWWQPKRGPSMFCLLSFFLPSLHCFLLL